MSNWKQVVKSVEGSDFSSSSKATPCERFVGNLRNQLALFKDSRKEGKRHFETKGDQTKFTARMGNMTVELLPGKRDVLIPTKEFAAVIEGVVADVEKGEFDAALNKIAANYSSRRKPAKPAK